MTVLNETLPLLCNVAIILGLKNSFIPLFNCGDAIIEKFLKNYIQVMEDLREV